MQHFVPCPILAYSAFKTNKNNDKTLTSIEDFEWDIKCLLDSGYSTVSLSTLHEYWLNDKVMPKKSICIVMIGGYENNYILAYPIIKHFGINVCFFIANQFVGFKQFAGIDNFCPHFDWNVAKEMYDSGLAIFYSMWHPLDNGDNMIHQINERIDELSNKFPGTNAKVAFWFHNGIEKRHVLEIMSIMGIAHSLIPILETSVEDIEKGILPINYVSPGYSLLDTADAFERRMSFLYDAYKTIKSINDNHNCCQIITRTKSEFVKLPIIERPLVCSYLRHAFPLSIIESHRKDRAELIVANDYIDILFRPWDNTLDFDNFHYTSWKSLDCCRLSRDMILKNGINVIQIIINNLEIGYYADVISDAFYIPEKWGYHTSHYTHCVLIYGYDNVKKSLLAISYTEQSHYEKFCIPYTDMFLSCSNALFHGINFVKNNSEVCIKYDRHSIIDKIQKYRDSQYDLSSQQKYYSWDSNQFIGAKACEKFADSIIKLLDSYCDINTVSLFAFLEHKRCMGWRLKYILQRDKKQDNCINDYVDFIKRETEIIEILAIRYNYERKVGVLMKLYNKIVMLNEKELDIIDYFLNLI